MSAPKQCSSADASYSFYHHFIQQQRKSKSQMGNCFILRKKRVKKMFSFPLPLSLLALQSREEGPRTRRLAITPSNNEQERKIKRAGEVFLNLSLPLALFPAFGTENKDERERERKKAKNAIQEREKKKPKKNKGQEIPKKSPL